MAPKHIAPCLLALVVGCTGSTPDVDAGTDARVRDTGPAPCVSDEACDDGLFCNGAEMCSEGRCVSGSAPGCDDGIDCTTDRCSEELRECVNEPPDADGDGVADAACLGVDGLPLGDDCDDQDRNRFPGNPEVCDDDDHDEDCDDQTFGRRDLDRDGFVDAACCNASTTGGAPTCGDDCDDLSRNTNPADSEQCNGIDDDCDGTVDEAIVFEPYYPDCDGDDFGDRDATPVTACVTPSEAPPCVSSRAGWTRNVGTDCDDTAAAINPAAVEQCNMVDDDCDDRTDEELVVSDWYPDCDRDGWGDETATPVRDCRAPLARPEHCAIVGEWAPRAGDCAEGNPARNPVSAELCNNVDDDCDGVVDDVVEGDFVCAFGQVEPCVSSCGEPGTHVCSNSCRSFGACSSEGIEVCNYCDEDGDGVGDEVALAYRVESEFPNCSANAIGEHVTCLGAGDERTVVLLDGTSEVQAGAMWLSTHDVAEMGYGELRLEVEVEVEGMPANGTSPIQFPIGGWAVVIATGGDPSLGSPQAFGVPAGSDMQGAAVMWHWTNGRACDAGSGVPFSQTDAVSYRSLSGGRRRKVGTSPDCTPGDNITFGPSSAAFDGPSAVTQRLTIEYTPDDPRTPGTDEERMLVRVHRPGSMGSQEFEYVPSYPPGPDDDIAIGAPLRIGLTAGSYNQTFSPGTFGMPVRVTATVWNSDPMSAPSDGRLVRVSTEGLCD